jgi:hypothetical protein
VCASILKELKTPHLNPDFGLIKQNKAFIRKFSGSQIEVDDSPSSKFIFFKFTAGAGYCIFPVRFECRHHLFMNSSF